MKFRQATREDHILMQNKLEFLGSDPIYSITEAWVTTNEEDARYWIIRRPYAFGQTRLQLWHERQRGEPFPEIFSEM